MGRNAAYIAAKKIVDGLKCPFIEIDELAVEFIRMVDGQKKALDEAEERGAEKMREAVLVEGSELTVSKRTIRAIDIKQVLEG